MTFATSWRRLDLSERHGIWCIVDADDYDWIIQHRWNYGWHRNTRWKFYAKRNVGSERSTVYLHRKILQRAYPDVVADDFHGDHRNGQSLDNRKANLRWLTADQNRRHRLFRGEIPSLETIIAGLAPANEMADVPF